VQLHRPVEVEAGEVIEVAVTHEIKISGDKSWVGTRITGRVGSEETYDEAHKRLDAKVQELVMRSVESTVETVKGYTK